jgi:hypothetical protein
VELPVTSATLPFRENRSLLIDGLQGTHGPWKEQVSPWKHPANKVARPALDPAPFARPLASLSN